MTVSGILGSNKHGATAMTPPRAPYPQREIMREEQVMGNTGTSEPHSFDYDSFTHSPKIAQVGVEASRA